MIEIIKTKAETCVGCDRCVRECPIEMANVVSLDENGEVKAAPDHKYCIACGRCFSVCKHEARYYEDDTARFFEDLAGGRAISLIAAPSIRTNIPEYKRIFTWLKQLGVKKIYDVSLGADLCTWAHIRYIEKVKPATLLTQPCPVIVKYCEIYRHDLLERLSPVHSPMGCICVYMKQYQGITDDIAALSPCIAKSMEFHDTGLARYNVTFPRLRDYIERNGIELPEKETGFDHAAAGLGKLFPMPGGLKANLEAYFGDKLSIDKAEGRGVFDALDLYAKSDEKDLPRIFDVLNCEHGCNLGAAHSDTENIFKINRVMDKSRRETASDSAGYFTSRYKPFDNALNYKRFMREYKPVETNIPTLTDEDIERAFELLGKDDDDKRHVDCFGCGSETCLQMARKIALGVNLPRNCIVKTAEDAEREHKENLLARSKVEHMEAMREAAERVQILLDSSPFAAHFWDEDLNIIDCNEAVVKLFNLSSKQEYMDRYFELTPEYQPDGSRSRAKLRYYVDKTFKEGVTRVNWMRRTVEGEPLPVEVTLVRVEYNDKKVIAGYCRDLREHNRMMSELAQAMETNELQLAKLGLVVKAVKIGLWDMEVNREDPVNPNNEFRCSDDFRRMLGYTDKNDFPDVIGSFTSSLHPEDLDRTNESMRRHLMDRTGQTPFDVEYRLRSKNGEYRYYKASGETIRDENGDPIRVAGAIMDITETKNTIIETQRLRNAAEAANKAKSAFLSTMSHEIRTPMNAILGITEIQLQNEDIQPDVKEALGKIYSSGDMLLGIINDILDLSKIEAGKLELVIHDYEIASLISDTAQLNMMRIGSKAIEFELAIDEDVPAYVRGDELRVKQILNNLLSNAFKYTNRGIVKLSVGYEKQQQSGAEVTLVFEVSDTGQGMTERQMDMLFDEYSRFNQKANRVTEGTGLGMSITRNLLKLMNGEIEVKSAPGKGSVFTVYIPQGRVNSIALGKAMVDNLLKFRSRSRAQMRRAQITRDPMPYGKVLVVDDVETNIYVAKGLLAPYGLKIDSAESGFAAIDKVKNGAEYDIIFMDHMMPGMDGIEATRHIRERGYQYPIVALTANAVAGQADVFLGNGFDDFISKPIDIRQLNSVLNKLIRDKHPPEVVEEARRRAKDGGKVVPKNDIDEEIAGIFVRDARRGLAVLEEIAAKKGAFSDEDIRAYVIQVHGLKSALANIGKIELSAVALKLEALGREGNIQAMVAETPAFLESMRNLIEKLAPSEDNGEVEDEDKELLREKLIEIKTACDDFDEKAADEAIAGLKQKKWSKTTKDLLNAISEYLLHSDFEEAGNAAEDYAGKL